MPSLSSILTCCGGNQKTLEAEAETRRARIVSVYNHTSNASLVSMTQTHPSLPPPNYSEAVRDRVIYLSADEKDARLFIRQEHDTQSVQQRSTSPAPTFSDESSVVSIPSTRLSAVTSTCTGNTTRLRARAEANSITASRNSWRDSITPSEFSSIAPPSYCAPSDDETGSEMGDTHPVMREGWLQRLRVAAEAEARTRALHIPER